MTKKEKSKEKKRWVDKAGKMPIERRIRYYQVKVSTNLINLKTIIQKNINLACNS